MRTRGKNGRKILENNKRMTRRSPVKRMTGRRIRGMRGRFKEKIRRAGRKWGRRKN
jgi:hypothetical protein